MFIRERREFTTSTLPDGRTSVSSDGRTVWVDRGMCLARFCPISHEYLVTTANEGTDGLSHPGTTVCHPPQGPFLPQWEDFLLGVRDRWGIEIGPEHKPLYV